MTSVVALLKVIEAPGDMISLLPQLFCFISIATRLKPHILLVQHHKHSPDTPPSFLSRSIIDFLAASSGMKAEEVEKCWSALKDVIWAESRFMQSIQDDGALEKVFQEHGIARGFRMLELVNSCSI
ncbi:hypothetical protein HGRIS_011212 [Hohenbuehelia grisea]|uniref:Uncharacterized protein n=1 Tax=Hohenbuehelia grisea TaxID=104357 RepID=A0ABR3JUN0_9AGAR